MKKPPGGRRHHEFPHSDIMCAFMTGPLHLRQVIPPLIARTSEGKIIRAWDYKQKSPLAILFIHADCPQCENWLGHLTKRSVDLIDRDAVALVIYSDLPPQKGKGLGPPFVAATDISGHSQIAFLGPDAFGSAGLGRVGAFVTDRYGDLFGQWTGRDADKLPPVEEILDLLDVIQRIC